MRLTVIGSGYVGLVAGACFSETGNHVTCADVDENKISSLKAGKIPIYEPGLDEIVKRNALQERLVFTTDIAAAVKTADIIFIAVGTPMSEDGSADLKYVLQVAETIGRNLNGYKVIVDKSTVPVGTAEKVKAKIAEFSKEKFDVVSNPEFLKEGAAIDDFLRPDRVVIGSESEAARKLMDELYAPFVRNNHPILFMDVKSAEMTKYAANAMLATRISFMNEIANLCDLIGADVDQVRKGIGTDSRIGQPFLYSGIGYGGSCFPKDVKAILKTASENGMKLDIIDAVERVNAKQKTVLISRMKEHFKTLKGRKFAVWGLAFKAMTDDVRESPAHAMIAGLLAEGASVNACDPEAVETTKKVFADKITYFKDMYACAEGCDALAVATDWMEFRSPDFPKLKSILKTAAIFDGRNLYNKYDLPSKGFVYFNVGSNRKGKSL